MGTKPPFKGHLSYASGAEAHGETKSFGSPPRVGQSKPYASGSNARGKSQAPRSGPRQGRADGGSSITQESAYRPKE